ncbi:MAG: hypothetical protein KUG59_06715 [Parvibaculaceae bacterium]|nr:hypothetical protein [Parvibaculaceae bacterium]
MFREWLHASAVVAGFFAGVPYWRDETEHQHRRINPDSVPQPRPELAPRAASTPANDTDVAQHAA